MTTEKRLAVVLTALLVFGLGSLGVLFMLARGVAEGLAGDGNAGVPAAGGSGDRRPLQRPAALVLDEEQLGPFLEIRRRLHEVYGNEDLPTILAKTTDPARRIALRERLEATLAEALAESPLSAQDYNRISRVVYDSWWRATAGGVDVFDELRTARRELSDLENKLRTARLDEQAAARTRAQRDLVRGEVERLEWSRSYEALKAREGFPEGTRRACEKRAGEINRYAMPALPDIVSS